MEGLTRELNKYPDLNGWQVDNIHCSEMSFKFRVTGPAAGLRVLIVGILLISSESSPLCISGSACTLHSRPNPSTIAE